MVGLSVDFGVVRNILMRVFVGVGRIRSGLVRLGVFQGLGRDLVSLGILVRVIQIWVMLGYVRVGCAYWQRLVSFLSVGLGIFQGELCYFFFIWYFIRSYTLGTDFDFNFFRLIVFSFGLGYSFVVFFGVFKFVGYMSSLECGFLDIKIRFFGNKDRTWYYACFFIMGRRRIRSCRFDFVVVGLSFCFLGIYCFLSIKL